MATRALHSDLTVGDSFQMPPPDAAILEGHQGQETVDELPVP